ncbi:MAG: cache domain-containing protein [Elainellaceae cyanobacterium]
MTAPGQNLWNAPSPNAVDQGDAAIAAPTTVEQTPAVQLVEPDVLTTSSRQQRPGLSIGVKATVLAACFGILPVLTVGFIGYRSADRSITENITHQEVEEVEQIASQLSTYMQERIANVNTVARLVNAFPVFDSDLSNRERLRLQESLAEQLNQFVEDYDTYTSIGVFDLSGDLLVQSSGTLEPSQANAPYFKEVLTTQGPAVSEPIALTGQGQGDQLLVYVAAPVTRLADEEIEAVVVAQITVNAIGDSVLGAGVSEEEEEAGDEVYRLVDSSGKIIQSLPLNLDKGDVGSFISEQIPGFDAAQAQREAQAWIGSTAQGETLVAYAPVEGLEELEWSVVASNSTAESFQAQRQLLETILLGTAITGITAVFLGVMLAKRATQPVEQVARTVALLGQGQLQARVQIHGNDELSILGHNVNRMAEQMQVLLQTMAQNAEQLGRQNDVLVGLSRNEALIRGDAQAATQAFTEVTAATLDVERVSVWIYEAADLMLRCLSDYSREDQTVEAVPTAAPDYLQAIATNQGRAVRDVHSHAELRHLLDQGHLNPNTVSLLEVPIQTGGSVVGVLRCEHTGSYRDWQPQEQIFVSSVANLVSLALESDVLQREVSHLLDVVSEVEDGNLTIQAKVSDRSTGLVADTFNRLIERLTEVMQQALETAQQASDSAQQQKQQADRIASNAEQQAQGVNQILQITDGVKALAQEAARRVEASRASMQTLQKTVEQGQNAVVEVTAGIDILQEGSDRIIQQMKTLGEFVGLADQFVQDQTQIATLTQTLALNASLVAARAAEQRDPRQFAVAAREFGAIAGQVSQLAQQTNDSLTTLEQRSAQIQSVVYTVDANVQRVGSLVENFTQGVEQSSQVFEDVEAVMTEAVDAEVAVGRASQEIMDAVQSATGVVRTITDIAAQTTELTQNNRQQSEQMETLSQRLLQTMVFFQLPTTPAPEGSPQLQRISHVEEASATAG